MITAAAAEGPTAFGTDDEASIVHETLTGIRDACRCDLV